MRLTDIPALWGCLSLAALALGATASVAQSIPEIAAGTRLRDALTQLDNAGLQILYSGGLVKRRMRVAANPTTAEPRALLHEILEPHDLTVEAAPNGAWVVVRASLDVVTAVDPNIVVADNPPISTQHEVTKIEEIVVAASRYSLISAASNSPDTLSDRDLEMAATLGEDAIRVANRLPGMASNGVSARSNVRGGDIDEMLVRLDGLRLYDPFHLKDFQSLFSSLDPRVVGSMDVYTGGYPAVFGNRMSGVIDIETMTPPSSRYHEIGVSFFNTSFLSSGEMASGDAEWVFSIRRSNLDVLYSAFSNQRERPRYRDTFGKISWVVNDRLQISGNVLNSSDDISLIDDFDGEERAEADHDDAYYWLRLDHTPRTFLQGQTIVSHASLNSNRIGTTAKQGISQGNLVDRRQFDIDTLQTDWTWGYSENLLLQYGGSMDAISGNYSYEDNVAFDILFDIDGAWTQPTRQRTLEIDRSGQQYAAYFNVRINPIDRLTADFGIRWDARRIGALHTSDLSPRLGVRYDISPRNRVRASIGRYSQAQTINELQISDGVTEFDKPQRADQFIVGFDHEWENGISLRVEAYEKRMTSLRPRYENLLNSRILLPELKPDRIRINPESANARGVELLLERQRESQSSWWFTYSYSEAKDTLAGVEVLRSWDQTHAISGGFIREFGMWTLSMASTARTGWPLSTASLDSSGAVSRASISQRNQLRLGAYRSIDLNLSRTVKLDRSEILLTIEMINSTNRANDCCVEYEIGDEEEAGQLVFKRLNYLPRIPSVGILWKF